MDEKRTAKTRLAITVFLVLVLVGSVWADPNLVLWYELDEMWGDIAYDSSDYENHGYVDADYGNPNWEPEGGYFGGCLVFDNDTDVECPISVLSKINEAITISVWVNGKLGQSSQWDMTVFDGGAGEPYKMTALIPDRMGDVVWRAGNISNDVLIWEEASPAVWQGCWHHFAFVKDEDAGTMSIYFDGFLADSNGTVASTLAYIKDRPFKIGAYVYHGNDYEGKLDDFRVYDYALSDEQIQLIYRGEDVNTAWDPSPWDGEVDVAPDANLVWRPGDYAASHDVYFGTGWDEVNDADTSSSVFKGNFEPNEYDPGGLKFDTIYYWRIDEVNNASVWKGNVWHFTTLSCFVVDDIEGYSQSCDYIFDTWLDGCGDVNGVGGNGTGSCIDLASSRCLPVHGGEQSMIYAYDNRWDGGVGYYSEIQVRTADLVVGPNWTGPGAEALTLYFYGNPDNGAADTERMYVGLEDSRGSASYAQVNYGFYAEDVNDVKVSEWHEWNIALRDFTGVELTDVRKLRIGFGDRTNTTVPGGYGLVFFDDVRLYPRRCIPQYGPEHDLSGNCIVDLADVGVMAKDWLRTDANLVVEEPCDANLVGWWKLDEGSGNTAGDSSDYNNHGTISGQCFWVPGRNGGSALQFEGGILRVPDTPQLRPPHRVSACAWINYEAPWLDSSRVVVKGRDNYETFALVGVENRLLFHFTDLNYDRYFVDSGDTELPRSEWVHLAGTFNGVVSKCFINGEVVGMNDDPSLVGIYLSQDTNDLGIGNRPRDERRPFDGIVDDVRVYNCGLSEAEVAWLATDGTGYVPLTLLANIYDEEPPGRKVINFRDFAVLLQSWLEEKLWPPEP